MHILMKHISEMLAYFINDNKTTKTNSLSISDMLPRNDLIKSDSIRNVIVIVAKQDS